MDHVTYLSPNAAVSLADVVCALHEDAVLPSRQCREMLAALKTVAALLGQPLAALPAEPRGLQRQLRKLSPASGGFSHKRLGNLRSLVLAALRHAGVPVLPGCARTRLSPAWQALRERLPDKTHTLGLSRFISFCSAQGQAPDAVGLASFAAFAAALEQDSFVKTPASLYRTTCRLWNRMAQAGDGWPRLIVSEPASRRRVAPLAWTDFPASFQADTEAFLSRKANQDPFATNYVKPVAPSTTRQRRKQILQIATALVGSGQPIAAVTDLASLVQVAHATAALRRMFQRQDDTKTTYLYGQALLLKTIARHWVRVDPAQRAGLQDLCAKLAISRTGMTEKNARRLLQFDNPNNVAAFVNLPRTTFARLLGQDDGHRRVALQAMNALAVELLTVAPIRADNLTGLRLDQHIRRIRVGSITTVHLLIPGTETKGKAPYQIQLPAETVALLATYQAHHHPRLCGAHLGKGSSPWLFPNPAGTRRSTVAFARGVCDFVDHGTGIDMNIHLFRHVAVKLHLSAHPEDIETARRLLAHKDTATTLRFYTEMKNEAAFRRYEQVLDELRHPPGPKQPGLKQPGPKQLPPRQQPGPRRRTVGQGGRS